MSTIAVSDRPATTWEIDPVHSQIEFQVSHLMLTKVRGRFEAAEGTVVLGPERDVTASTVEAVIQAASIRTGQPQRDEHLRSADFFDVERFPTLTFASRSVKRRDEGQLTVIGDLTIRGVTREVELAVTELGTAGDPWGGERIGFRATATIDRREYGLTWNQALETGGIAVGHEVKITLEIQAVRRDA